MARSCLYRAAEMASTPCRMACLSTSLGFWRNSRPYGRVCWRQLWKSASAMRIISVSNRWMELTALKFCQFVDRLLDSWGYIPLETCELSLIKERKKRSFCPMPWTRWVSLNCDWNDDVSIYMTRQWLTSSSAWIVGSIMLYCARFRSSRSMTFGIWALSQTTYNMTRLAWASWCSLKQQFLWLLELSITATSWHCQLLFVPCTTGNTRFA